TDRNVQSAKLLIEQINSSDRALANFGFGRTPPDYDERLRAFLKSLSAVDAIVRRILATKHPTDKDIQDLEDAAADMQLKERSGAGGLTFIKVHARPMGNNQEQAGYQVWWSFQGDAEDDKAYTKMAADSANAFADLVPGLYSMYTRKGNRRG